MKTILTELKSFGLTDKQFNDIHNNFSFGFNFIVRTTTKLTPKAKTTWNVESIEKELCTESEHNNATSNDTIKFFKRLGGKESVERSYTSVGEVVTKIVSTSPNGQNKTIREYKFFNKNFDLTPETYLNKILTELKNN
jgi:translation initiation factor 2B subunit (eIF-2B alpha/beta/delta family)